MSLSPKMKILLVGEYSGVHTTLSTTLRDMGYSVTTVNDGDGIKGFPSDVLLDNSQKISIPGFQLILDWLGFKGFLDYLKNRKELKNTLQGYDVIQFINTAPITAYSSFANLLLVRDILKVNAKSKLFLCALGDDYAWVKKNLSSKKNNSYFNRLSISNIKHFLFSLKYLYGFGYRTLNKYVIKNTVAIIPGLEDYKVAYEGHPKIVDIIRLPLDESIYKNAVALYQTPNSLQNSDSKSIFHGWQVGSEIRKGNDLLDLAAKNAINHVKGHVEVSYNVVRSVPYSEYVTRFDDADIFLDQIYSLDRGYNAILGMAKGKVVLSGFHKEVTEDGKCSFGVNATNDLISLSKTITELLLDEQRMNIMKINALKYVIDNHNPSDVTRKYTALWSSYLEK